MAQVEFLDNTQGGGGMEHSHLNLLILNQLGDSMGKLTYRGFQIEGVKINDQGTGIETTFSSAKILSELAKKLDSDLLGEPNGVATLGADGKIPSMQIPTGLKEIQVVANIAERDAIPNRFAGMTVLVLDASADTQVGTGSAEYRWTGSTWWRNTATTTVVLDWNNIAGKPSSTPANIDLAVANSHIHTNLLTLMGLGEDNGNLTYKGKPVAQPQGNVLMFVATETNLPAQGSLNVLYVVLEDTTNMGKPSIYMWDSNSSSYTVVGGSGGGGGSSTGLQQVTKLNVVAPKTIDLTIPESIDFILPEVVVLKFIAGIQDQLLALCNFDNSDATDFEENSNVLFDGAMRLKTTIAEPMTAGGTAGTFTVQEFVLDTTKYTGITALAIG